MSRAAKASALCAFLACAACAHERPVVQLVPTAPLPDQEAMREAQGDMDVQRYVSARAYQHAIAAMLARQEDDLPAAAAELREALLYDPDSSFLHTLFADVLLRQGRLADAEEELHTALAGDPLNAEARLYAARVAVARDRPGDARAHLHAAIDAAPDDPDAYRELVRLEVAQGDLDAAGAAAEALGQAALKAQKAALAEQREQDDDEAQTAPQGSTAWTAERLREHSAAGEVDLARAHAARHEDDAAARAYARAEEFDPSDSDALASHAQFLESRRQWAQARELQLRVLLQRPESPEVLAALARLSLEEGDPETAQAHARKLLLLARDLEPGPAKPGPDARLGADGERRELGAALLRVAVPLLGVRRSAQAQAALEGALRLFPGHPELGFYRGLAVAQQGRPREAAQAFEQLEKQLQRQREEETAGQSFLGVDKKTLLLDVRVQVALAKGRAGETAEALRRLRVLFAEHPLEDGVALALLDGFDRAGKGAEAVALLEAAVKSHGDSDALLFALGNAQDRTGKGKEAQATMRRLLALSPQNAGALNYVGYTLTEGGTPAQLEEAQELLTRAVEERPDDGAIADSFGYCLFKRGQVARSLEELRRANKLAPDDPIVLSHLGDALFASGKRDEAEQIFREALTRLQAPPPQRKRGKAESPRAAIGTPGGEAESGELDPTDRSPEPGDARVREELEQKLRSLTAR